MPAYRYIPNFLKGRYVIQIFNSNLNRDRATTNKATMKSNLKKKQGSRFREQILISYVDTLTSFSSLTTVIIIATLYINWKIKTHLKVRRIRLAAYNDNKEYNKIYYSFINDNRTWV